MRIYANILTATAALLLSIGASASGTAPNGGMPGHAATASADGGTDERDGMATSYGILPADSQMPSVRSLAVDLSINPNTIQKAYSLLEQQGYIYSVKGRGNYAADVTALAEKERQSVLKEAERLIAYGRGIGITHREYIEIIDRLYRKGDTDDRV